LRVVMKVPAVVLLISLLAAFHAPLVAAAYHPGMDCCRGGMSGMCCPLSGSCSLRSCGADEREALLSALSVFVLPGPAAPMRPSPSSLAPAIEVHCPVSEASPVLDPPPRG
jgi:hypothetical protein